MRFCIKPTAFTTNNPRTRPELDGNWNKWTSTWQNFRKYFSREPATV